MTSELQLGLASIATVRQYFRLAEAKGLSPEDLCSRASLPVALAHRNTGTLAGIEFQRLLRCLADTLQDPLLGLRSGDFVEPGSYSLVGYITMSCATLGEAIAQIAPYEKLVGDMGVTTVTASPQALTLTWHCAYTDPLVRRHLIDNVFASWISYARWLADLPEAAPVEVRLTHDAPGAEHEQIYQQYWDCPVRFNQSDNSLVIARNLLDTPLRQPDPVLRQTLEEHALSRMAELKTDLSFSTRVRNAIHLQLRQGVTRQDLVAEHLALTPRTLQRRLQEEGLSYQQLLDEIRAEVARDYLLRTPLPTQDIALRLGFSEVRSFHRQFKVWTGTTPGAFRAEKQQTEQSSPFIR